MQSLVKKFITLGFDISQAPDHLSQQAWQAFEQFLSTEVASLPLEEQQSFIREGFDACLRSKPSPFNEKSLLWLLDHAPLEVFSHPSFLSGTLQISAEHQNENVWNKVIDKVAQNPTLVGPSFVFDMMLCRKNQAVIDLLNSRRLPSSLWYHHKCLLIAFVVSDPSGDVFSAILHSPQTLEEEKTLAQCLCENFLARETGMRGRWNENDLEKFWQDMKTTSKTFQQEVWHQVGVFENKTGTDKQQWVVSSEIKALRQKFLISEKLELDKSKASLPPKKM